jgi:hypothetical protein
VSPSVEHDLWLHLLDVVGDRHDEAQVCADAGAYVPAMIMIGSAVEGALLATALRLEDDLRQRGLWPAGDPLRWDLDQLLKLGIAADWFTAVAPGEHVLLDEGELGDAIFWLKHGRNLIHPGAFIRTIPREVEIGKVAFENAYAVLDAVFAATVEASEMSGGVRGGHTPRHTRTPKNAD